MMKSCLNTTDEKKKLNARIGSYVYSLPVHQLC